MRIPCLNTNAHNTDFQFRRYAQYCMYEQVLNNRCPLWNYSIAKLKEKFWNVCYPSNLIYILVKAPFTKHPYVGKTGGSIKPDNLLYKHIASNDFIRVLSAHEVNTSLVMKASRNGVIAGLWYIQEPVLSPQTAFSAIRHCNICRCTVIVYIEMGIFIIL